MVVALASHHLVWCTALVLLAELQDLLPGIINQLGPDNLANLKKLAETYQSGAAPPPTAGADDDEDVPDLVDNFEEAAK